MKRILAAVDGSDASLHAVRHALAMSDAMGAEVTLVHVVPLVFVPAEVPFDAGRLAEDAQKAGEALLEATARELGRPAIQKVCVRGSAAEVMTEMAETEGYDLVVVGSKGRGAVARVLIGSTTDRLVHICHKPVLVVR